MKIFVTGTRGIPDIPGGVESHCQQLYPLIVNQGHQVKISRRKPYVISKLSSSEINEWEGIKLIDNFSPKKKSIEAIVHTFIAILEAKKWGADIIHIHAIGPAIMVPFARLIGLKVVITDHGPDYDRDKWGVLAKFVLRLGEKWGGIFANEVIVISEVIRSIIKERCHRDSHLIYNGVQILEKVNSTSYIDSLGLHSGNYIIAVARFVPEKGLHDLIEAYNQSELTCKLVLVGDSDHEDDYSRNLKKMAALNSNIILTGYIIGNDLRQIFSHARLFVLPSYHEGLPIVLLEALSYGLIPLVSDIPANLEVNINSDYYFHTKNIKNLKDKLIQLWGSEFTKVDRGKLIEFVRQKYDWQKISEQTIEVYKTVLN
ncbi:MAG: glycosyltransferase family 4 protein [Bacteroidetes bacterium]|nr:glycosyltransferase family 4 protein [Bacteroidota bacterium]